MDLAQITTTLGLFKTGFDTLRTAMGLVKDVQGVLPEGEKKDVVGRTLDEADKQLVLAEVQIAQALGYPLCRCQFPPIPMLKVGWASVPRSDVKYGGQTQVDAHECPKCGQKRCAALSNSTNNNSSTRQRHRRSRGHLTKRIIKHAKAKIRAVTKT